ncbi:MAG: hypothetical protein ACRYFK_12515 [Janthinobacterium lividum]
MKKLLPLLPVAVLALGSCSSEPSDWRANEKVSLDMIPPGTRPSDNFDQNTNEAPSSDKGGAIPRPVSSNPSIGGSRVVTPAETMSADTQEGTAETGEEQNARKRKRGQEPTPNAQIGAPEANKQEVQGSNQAGSPDQKTNQ